MSQRDTNGGGFIGRVIAGSARQRFLTVLFVSGLAVWGYYAMTHGPLDAIPDLSDVQVIVFTEWSGQSPDIIEDQITYPISTPSGRLDSISASRSFTAWITSRAFSP